jgi:hypothetical protein
MTFANVRPPLPGGGEFLTLQGYPKCASRKTSTWARSDFLFPMCAIVQDARAFLPCPACLAGALLKTMKITITQMGVCVGRRCRHPHASKSVLQHKTSILPLYPLSSRPQPRLRLMCPIRDRARAGVRAKGGISHMAQSRVDRLSNWLLDFQNEILFASGKI